MSTPNVLLSELQVSEELREKLPFRTCERWQQQRITLLTQPQPLDSVVERSFSWCHRGEDGWSFRGNEALVCPRCQTIWAHLDFGRPMALGEARDCLWPRAQTCEFCEPTGGEVPGSLLDVGPYNTDLPLLFSLPAELVKREAELHIKSIEREIHGRIDSSISPGI